MGNTLTFDLGTSSTKAALWSDDGLVAVARAPLHTEYPHPGWAEQDPEEWWRSVVEAARHLQADRPEEYGAIEAIGFSATRESFALIDADGRAHGPGILWSDTRAGAEVADVAARCGGADSLRAETGAYLNGSACFAKLTWVTRHRADDLAAARWVLAPRDLIVARMTGEVATDPTLASRSGLYGFDGTWLTEASDLVGDLLPPVRPSTDVVGVLRADAAEELALPAGVKIVLGAGDRACEVLGTGATAARPMVSWGTTTSLSVPVADDARPPVGIVTRGALGGSIWEAGLSAGGAALAWFAGLTGTTHDDLLVAAAGVAPGAGGVLALPWLTGARAPWWRPEAEAAFVSVAASDGPPELARALIEAVGLDVARSVELLTPDAQALQLAGGGARMSLWRLVLGGATGLPLLRRRSDEAGSVGARIIVGEALGRPVDVDTVNPVEERIDPDEALIAAYRPVRRRSDAAAAAILAIPET